MPEVHDPRVFFAAVQALLAWQRSGLALMAFGFVIERFSLFSLCCVWRPNVRRTTYYRWSAVSR